MDINSIISNVDGQLIKNITKKLVSFDSQNPPGRCDHIAKYLQKLAAELGFESEIFPLDDERHNVVLSFGKGSRDIVLSGHLDTVPIGDLSQWKHPPLEVHEENGKLFGRGTADMKGGVATLIGSMDAIAKSDISLDHRIIFAGTADEEVGMNGALELQKEGIMDKADGLIITEATSLRVGIAEKGPYWIRLNVKGKAAHGSMPEIGVNAIEGACKAIEEIKDILPEISHKLLGKSTVNAGLISGGSKINVVPEECSVDCDFRLVPGVDMKAFDLKVGDLMTQLTTEEACSFSHEILHSIPALSTEANEPLIQSLLNWSSKVANIPSEPIGLSYGTDAAALIPPKSIPFAIFGGGSASIIHQANEYVPLDELVQAAQIITAALLENYAKK